MTSGKSLAGAIPVARLFPLLAATRGAMCATEVVPMVGVEQLDETRFRFRATHFRLRPVYCPACGEHRTGAVDALAEWPPQVPHITCAECAEPGPQAPCPPPA